MDDSDDRRAPGGRPPRQWVAALAMLGLAAGAAAARPADAQPKLPKTPLVKDLAPAQRKPRPERNDDVPPSARPPAGMCRIWLDNVPAAQQPAATDCPSAIRNRPADARVIFGDDYVRRPDGADATATGAAPAMYAVLDRVHGPNAGESAAWEPAAEDSTARRGGPAARPAPRPAERPAPRADEWEAGYAAGYRDAMQGRRPRVRGVDRAAPGAAESADQAGGPDDRGVFPGDQAARPVVVVPQGGDDPRYFNNGRYAPPGRANGVCLDRDADGWCDDPRFGPPVCRDLDGDGRCDDVPALAAAPYPAALPSMRAGADVFRGRGSDVALRWLGTTEVVARVSDLRGTGSPSRVTWLDANTGALLQVWSDRDGDGVADRVEIYRDGRRVKLIGR
jgi:hypothetical protein